MKARFAEQPAYIIRALGFSDDVFDVPVLIIKDSRNARTREGLESRPLFTP